MRGMRNNLDGVESIAAGKGTKRDIRAPDHRCRADVTRANSSENMAGRLILKRLKYPSRATYVTQAAVYSRLGVARIPLKSESPAPGVLRQDLTRMAAAGNAQRDVPFAPPAELHLAPMATARESAEPLLSPMVRAGRRLSLQLAHYRALEVDSRLACLLPKLICPILLSADTCRCRGSVQFVSTQKTPSQTVCEGNPGADCGFLGMNNSAVPNLETVPIAALYSYK